MVGMGCGSCRISGPGRMTFLPPKDLIFLPGQGPGIEPHLLREGESLPSTGTPQFRLLVKSTRWV